MGIAPATAPPGDWTEPGAYAVAPGVFRIPLPLPTDGLRAVNVYALVDDTELVLIDAGWALEASRTQLAHALSGLGRELGDISRFLVTHVHRDHYTQAVAIRRQLGTRVSIGAGEQRSLELLSRPGRQASETQLHRLHAAGATPLIDALTAPGRDRSVDRTNWEMPDDWIADGATLRVSGRGLRAIRTPGHTQGHVVFADTAGGVLFAGDHVLPHITPSIALEPVHASLPLGDYMTALAAMRELPDMRLLPAHGPVTASVHTRVDELLAHHEDRLDASAAAVLGGAATAYEVAQVLRWSRRATPFGDLDLFNQTLAVSETLAHLDVLTSRGRLERTGAEPGLRYTVVE